MTAHAMVEERQRCMEAGMDDHVIKPIDPDVMFATLGKWFRSGHASGSPAPAKAERCLGGPDSPKLNWVNISDGMRRVAGNDRLYFSLVRQFIEGQSGIPEQIRQAMTSGDLKTAERLAHTIKGVSGNLGAAAVQEAAASLEGAIRHGDGSPHGTGALLDALASALKSTVAELETLVESRPAERPAMPPADVDPARLKSIVERLEEMITESDGDTLDYLESVMRDLSSAFTPEDVAGLEKAVQGFDFEEAQNLLRKMASRRDPTPGGECR
jgi:HPt (histidine-containing phosphotransfer) domain-containing protein